MKIKEIKINPKKISDKEINEIVNNFKQGKVIAYPTDTIYGIGCLATNKEAIKKIYKIKKRSRQKPLLILASSFSMVKKYCFLSRKQEKFLKNKSEARLPQACGSRASDWHGSISAILKSRNLLPKELTGWKDSVAVRIPQNNFLIKIIKKIGVPIVSTSLNISGRKNISDIDNINNYFKGLRPDLLINAGNMQGKPSKLVDLRDINNIIILRK